MRYKGRSTSKSCRINKRQKEQAFVEESVWRSDTSFFSKLYRVDLFIQIIEGGLYVKRIPPVHKYQQGILILNASNTF